MPKDVICADCGQTFTVETGFRSGRISPRCEPCRIEHNRAVERNKQYRWRAKNPDKWREVQARANAVKYAKPDYRQRRLERDAKRLYGATPEELQAILDSQRGLCAICGGSPGKIGAKGTVGRLHLDHDHRTGKLRGFLCGNCNTMLGLAKESREILLRAMGYLERFEPPPVFSDALQDVEFLSTQIERLMAQQAK